MDIVIIAQYLSDLEHLEKTNGRFIYLAQLLKENPDNRVEIVTTSFLHWNKKQAEIIPKEFRGCKITVIHEPGYPKNVCLKRFSSHRQLAKNIRTYLNSRKVPDVIYAAVPSLVVADVASQYCKKNHVRFIVDIQDLWPEAFKMVVNIPILSDMAFWPMQKQADRIYSSAEQIVAVSETYAKRGMRVNQKCKKATVVYLGTDKNVFDQYSKNYTENFTGIQIGYVGSLSSSYDLLTIIEAISRLKAKENIKLLVMGEGGARQKFEEKAQELDIICEFTGSLPYTQMIGRLCTCDIAVNPIHKGSAGSIINKVCDYAMAGLPVVNTQESEEYRKLLSLYNAGINCRCECVGDVIAAFEKLINNPELRKQMAKNSRKLGIEQFDREKSYKSIINIIEK